MIHISFSALTWLGSVKDIGLTRKQPVPEGFVVEQVEEESVTHIKLEDNC